jgi:hypothetical protein
MAAAGSSRFPFPTARYVGLCLTIKNFIRSASWKAKEARRAAAARERAGLAFAWCQNVYLVLPRAHFYKCCWGILPQGIIPVTAACNGRPLLVTAACNGRPLPVTAAPAEPPCFCNGRLLSRPPALCNGRLLSRPVSVTAAC